MRILNDALVRVLATLRTEVNTQRLVLKGAHSMEEDFIIQDAERYADASLDAANHLERAEYALNVMIKELGGRP